jgi:UDP-2,3-diacylglucosamine hydrolase
MAGPTLFLSDLHLSAERPGLLAAFASFCQGPARAAGAVYILGDLFDAWLGDDQLREPVAAQVARELRAVAEAGVHVAVMQGNRDFLLGERFGRAAGATLLPDEIVVDVEGTRTLLLHGDLLCTADASYQKYRAWTRSARVQRRMLALPYVARRAIARGLRGQSRRTSAMKPEAIMDVTEDAVVAAFRAHGVTRMVHGHTHRPARHVLTVDGRTCERLVLADWYERGSYLECSATAVTARTVS